VSVVDQTAGVAVTGLQVTDFEVFEAGVRRTVEAVDNGAGPAEFLLVVDTSVVGGLMKPVVLDVIAELRASERMALVTFDSTARIVQDFTGDRDILRTAMLRATFQGDPRLNDGLAVALAKGFPRSSGGRRVILLCSAGIEGASRTAESTVIDQARSKGISVFPIFMQASWRSIFDSLARKTGGATFSVRDLRKVAGNRFAARIMDTVRQPYIVTLSGSTAGDNMQVKIKGRERVFTSAIPLP
jgi:hypothetical protein